MDTKPKRSIENLFEGTGLLDLKKSKPREEVFDILGKRNTQDVPDLIEEEVVVVNKKSGMDNVNLNIPTKAQLRALRSDYFDNKGGLKKRKSTRKGTRKHVFKTKKRRYSQKSRRRK